MNAQPDFKALAELCGKLNEFDAAMQKFVLSQSQLADRFRSYHAQAARVASHVRAGQPVKATAQALYETLKPCPGAFSTIAEQAERLSGLTGELNAIIFEKFLK